MSPMRRRETAPQIHTSGKHPREPGGGGSERARRLGGIVSSSFTLTMAGRGVARARVELLLAVSMVTGSHGACLVQPLSVSWGGGAGLAGILSEFLVTAYVEEMFPRVLVKFKRNVFRPD